MCVLSTQNITCFNAEGKHRAETCIPESSSYYSLRCVKSTNPHLASVVYYGTSSSVGWYQTRPEKIQILKIPKLPQPVNEPGTSNFNHERSTLRQGVIG
ncbi:jg2387 [Pararge aegeria aegeria]|uniref:Jg2387 protein n=1 Tax=Pararge aegeria aegeria TaxID=348720 RepID=A0A8S4S174_9NEOP|nr:jg2387 [Pararge aegeria aegeria]